MEASGYGRGHRFLEIASIGIFLTGIACLAFRAAHSVHGALDLLWLSLTALAGYLIADFFSGFIHWAGDTLGDESTPMFGPNFVRPFREHHTDQKGITRHDFIETNGNNCIVSVPVVLLLDFEMPAAPGLWFYASAVMAFCTWFVFCTNQFHKWAHDDHVPRWVRRLQDWGLILSPEHHAIHHAAPHDKYYCITVGWMDPVLFRLRFFRGCEAIVARLFPGFLHLGDRERPSRS
ncbi:MAG TPA: fatty acid desaturase CarF family protein [Polyangia bacterium]|jgi:ubiquitin-conjugating enzyme E2 variant|nr:fatty acid desaturase CarF family protein [Polyangia bacterium]